MFQQIIIVGNLGQDPEMRYTPSGVPVTSFQCGNQQTVDRTGRPASGEDRLVSSDGLARGMPRLQVNILAKGRQVLVIGEMEEPSTWTDRDGNNRASLEVTARTIRFMGGRGDAEWAVATAVPRAAELRRLQPAATRARPTRKYRSSQQPHR